MTNRRPATEAEWALMVEQRLDSLETPRIVRLGKWQITTQNDQLVVVNALTGAVTVIAS